LHLATEKGDPELIELLCRNGCDPDIQDLEMKTAAHSFAYSCKLSLLKVLCLYNADLSLTSSEGFTPLLSCAGRKGKRDADGWQLAFNLVGVELVKLLIASEADPNASDLSGNTGLIHAATNGNLEMVKELLQCGADRSIENKLKQDALKSASSKMHYGVSNVLMTVKAEESSYLDNLRSWRALEILCHKDQIAMAYSTTERNVICEIIPEFAFGLPEVPEEKEEDPQLHTFAVRNASAKEVNGVYKYRSLRDGFATYDQLVNGKTYMIIRKAPKGRKNPVWFVCNRESDFYFNTSSATLPPALRWSKCKGIPSPTPHLTKGIYGSWFAYAELGEAAECSSLIENGVHPDIPDRDGNTAGHLAAKNGQIEILKLLSESGADFNLSNYHGERPLLVSGKSGCLRSYDCLLDLCGSDALTEQEEAAIWNLSSCDQSVAIREQLVFIAIDRGQLFDIQYAKESGLSLKAKNVDSQPPIQYALSKSKFYIVNSILTGAYTNAISKEEWRDFFKSVSSGDARGMNAGFKKGIHIDMPNRLGRTAFMTAVLKDHKPLIKILLERGANLNLQDNEGRSLLMLICLKGTEEQLNFLLSKGTVDVNQVDRSGNCALHNCIMKQRLSLIKALLTRDDINVNLTNNKKESILHLAVLTGKAAIVNLVLTTECDINLRDENNFCALYYAVVKENQAVIKTLVDRGAKLNETESNALSMRWMNSADDGNMRAINCMIAAGVNVEQTNRTGLSAILVATMGGQKNVLHALLAAGANINVVGDEGQTCVHIAAIKNDTELMQILIEGSADLNRVNQDNQTPLDIAQLEGFEEISELLIALGATHAEEDDEDGFMDDEDATKREFIRCHSMSVLISLKDTPLLRVAGSGELDGIYKLQPEPHAGRKLYKSDNFCIRWCQDGWIIDEEVRDEPKGAAVLIADIESPACECDVEWMLLENGEWVEAPELHVQPAVFDINLDENDDSGDGDGADFSDLQSVDSVGGSTLVE